MVDTAQRAAESAFTEISVLKEDCAGDVDSYPDHRKRRIRDSLRSSRIVAGIGISYLVQPIVAVLSVAGHDHHTAQ
jgi:hypothetical protein